MAVQLVLMLTVPLNGEVAVATLRPVLVHLLRIVIGQRVLSPVAAVLRPERIIAAIAMSRVAILRPVLLTASVLGVIIQPVPLPAAAESISRHIP